MSYPVDKTDVYCYSNNIEGESVYNSTINDSSQRYPRKNAIFFLRYCQTFSLYIIAKKSALILFHKKIILGQISDRNSD